MKAGLINKEKALLVGTFTGRKLSMSLGGDQIIAHWLLKVTSLRWTRWKALSR